MVETWTSQRWPSSSFVNGEYPMSIGKMTFSLSFFRLVWRSVFVVAVTVLAMTMPFFNEMLALLGAIGFWPLTIYFPVEMYIARKKIKKGTIRWFGLKTLSLGFMLLSVAIACAAIHGMNQALRKYKPFMYKE
ncbi:Amino acid permease 6 [Spatholobus suberectus]|nr:Amino acid permease 6 [Spatholobus suberectus]